MEFNVNSPILFIITGIILLLVIGQSVFFLVRAIKRVKELGVDKGKIKSVIIGSALFTIAPAAAIVIGVITLSKSLGIALPWFRLSIVGSLTYEVQSSTTAMSILGISPSETITDASTYATIFFVMTSGILSGTLLTPLLGKKIHLGLMNIEKKDKRWAEILTDAMFIGMISAFLGFVFCDVSNLFASELPEGVSSRTACLVAPLVMFTSAIVVSVLGSLGKKPKLRWMMDYALPISLISGMAMAIPLTIWLG